jgi:hypothetical protein
MNKVFQFTAGRTTFFALVFFGFGAGLAIAGKLDGNYIALVTALQAAVVVRAVAEDKVS